jgi:hypothetical protein
VGELVTIFHAALFLDQAAVNGIDGNSGWNEEALICNDEFFGSPLVVIIANLRPVHSITQLIDWQRLMTLYIEKLSYPITKQIVQFNSVGAC